MHPESPSDRAPSSELPRHLNEPSAGDRGSIEPSASTDRSPAVASQAVHRLVSSVEPEELQPIIARCLAGELSPHVAVMQMLCETESAAVVRLAVDAVTKEADRASRATDAIIRDRVDALTRLVVEHEDGVDRIADMLRSGVDTSASAASVEEGIAHCERLFDWSVRQSEEASVALYSLGSPEVLERATAEIVDLLDEWGVLGRERAVMQIGCGIGRFEAALAPRVREAHGIDVSSEMVNAARRRTAELVNVYIEKCSGRDLSRFDAGQFDLVYAIDTFPYLVQSGMPLVERHFEEARRVLTQGGDFVILNFSYRDDLAADRSDVRRLAGAHGFELIVDGSQPLALWNGVAWRMRKT